MLKEHAVALVISDLRLPDLDGLALLKQIRELRPEVEVVMITGHGSVEKAVEAMKYGAYDFIQKPLDATALLKTVAKAIKKHVSPPKTNACDANSVRAMGWNRSSATARRCSR